ncbi:hypothetical protein EX30DRAFT_88402 [Ascodesmis nigricans]|uniref:Uncharacterized protein n=1 Tax=Ascodesmis nigricans TaxID=341454 RepID=A0A4S2N3B1_9PEZI|nr:hypothetical protein EX30DRAFT_88402 [Ascodesmis nigricans]
MLWRDSLHCSYALMSLWIWLPDELVTLTPGLCVLCGREEQKGDYEHKKEGIFFLHCRLTFLCLFLFVFIFCPRHIFAPFFLHVFFFCSKEGWEQIFSKSLFFCAYVSTVSGFCFPFFVFLFFLFAPGGFLL